MNDGYTFRHAARMEWVKLRTLRSVRWTLVGGMAGTIAMGAVVGLSTRGATSDPTSNVLAGTLMTGAYLALTGLTGLGLGVAVRHSAAAVATLVGGLFVAPVVIGAATRNAARFMPELIAGNSLAAVKPVAGFPWSPWLELGIVALYPAVLLAAGTWLLVHRDA